MLFITMGVILLMMWMAVVESNGHHAESSNTNNILQILGDYWYSAIYVVVIGPILEELAFRAALYQLTEKICSFITKNEQIVKITSYLIVGILFSIMHEDNFMGIYMIISWVFQGVTNKYGLKYAIGAHVGSNLFTLLFTFI